MHVVGTAGHVDHGKSTLVRTLTGIDPDRLQEEKDRGMTIDLGFAWLRLPNGEEISIVDVPGHERFIKNMLAGVGGIDFALVVIAADEGVMPQTIEHIAILDLLRVQRAIIVITKVDLVDADWLELVHQDIQEFIGRTGLAGAPIVEVSAHTGQGIADLLTLLEKAIVETPPRPNMGRPRLAVDRVFTVAGFGTVVTGTLVGGDLAIGQEVEVLPGASRSRIRGLQTHKTKVNEALPGSRVAINLVGIPTEDIHRGQIVTSPGWLIPTRALDVSLRVVRDTPHPLEHDAVVTFHSGSAETEARVLLFEGGSLAPDSSGWGQLRLSEPVAVVKGDLFVLRTSNHTIAGGEVVDPRARRHRRSETGLVEGLEILQQGSLEEAALAQIATRGPIDLATLAERLGVPTVAMSSTIASLANEGRIVKIGDFLVSEPRWRDINQSVKSSLGEFHVSFPLRPGMPREELRGRLGFPGKFFSPMLARLASENVVSDHEGIVRLPEHVVHLSAEQEERVNRLIEILDAVPFSPPRLDEVPASAQLTSEELHAVAEAGRIVRVDVHLAFTPTAYDDMKNRIIAHLNTHDRITVADARDLLGSSRKYVLALLESLDRQRVTRRFGDDRILM